MFVLGLRGEVGLKYLVWYLSLICGSGVSSAMANFPSIELALYFVFLAILFVLTRKCHGDYSRFKSASPNVWPYFEPTMKQRVVFFWFDFAVFSFFGLVSTALLIQQDKHTLDQPLIVVATFLAGHLALVGLFLGSIAKPTQY